MCFTVVNSNATETRPARRPQAHLFDLLGDSSIEFLGVLLEHAGALRRLNVDAVKVAGRVLRAAEAAATGAGGGCVRAPVGRAGHAPFTVCVLSQGGWCGLRVPCTVRRRRHDHLRERQSPREGMGAGPACVVGVHADVFFGRRGARSTNGWRAPGWRL